MAVQGPGAPPGVGGVRPAGSEPPEPGPKRGQRRPRRRAPPPPPPPATGQPGARLDVLG